MHTVPLSLRAHRAGYAAVLVMVGAGAVLFLVLEWSPPASSRPALGLQALAVRAVGPGAGARPSAAAPGVHPLVLAGVGRRLRDEQMFFLQGCQRGWDALLRPDRQLTTGIDRDYMHARATTTGWLPVLRVPLRMTPGHKRERVWIWILVRCGPGAVCR